MLGPNHPFLAILLCTLCAIVIFSCANQDAAEYKKAHEQVSKSGCVSAEPALFEIIHKYPDSISADLARSDLLGCLKAIHIDKVRKFESLLNQVEDYAKQGGIENFDKAFSILDRLREIVNQAVIPTQLVERYQTDLDYVIQEAAKMFQYNQKIVAERRNFQKPEEASAYMTSEKITRSSSALRSASQSTQTWTGKKK